MKDYQVRNQEQPKTWFRAQRVYLASAGQWYFRTREGIEIGPYESQFEAEVEAGLFKELVKNVRGNADARTVIRDFVLESCQLGHELKPHFNETEEKKEAVG